LQSTRHNSHPDWARGWIAALLAVCILALPAASHAHQASGAGKVAAIPILPELGNDSLPQVLSTQDASLYREIFALQIAGKWRAADQRIDQLSDARLIGHVLAQRYLHPTAYRSKYKELRDWMAHYADHPEARRIYKLALKRRPKNYKHPKRPAVQRSGLAASRAATGPKPYRSTKRLSKKERDRKSTRLNSSH
jgi:hypothetical protein